MVVLALLGATSSAMADGIDDFEGCRAAANLSTTAANALRAGFCMGIVEGLMWSLPGWGVVCLPKGVTTGQGLKVLLGAKLLTFVSMAWYAELWRGCFPLVRRKLRR